MEEDPPRVTKKRTLRDLRDHDRDRYVQSTHDVSKFKELDNN